MYKVKIEYTRNKQTHVVYEFTSKSLAKMFLLRSRELGLIARYWG